MVTSLPQTFAPGVTLMINGTAYLGSVESGVDQDWADSEASEPDINWSHVDSKGHFHAFDTYSSELPTLLTRSVLTPCNATCADEGCEGYLETRYHCRICDERIHPKWNTVTRATKVGELHWWKATATGPMIMIGAQVSVRVRNNDWPEKFGIATVSEVTISSDTNYAELTLTGIGRLGFRPLPEGDHMLTSGG